jgi:nitrate/nitrite transport system substrate-binding protein
MQKTAGWALIRDKVINKEYDASHMLAPMPLAMSMGLGSQAVPTDVATIQNINGQAITMHIKHKDKRDPKNWKGFKFACRSTTPSTTCCCATTWPSTASTRTRMSRLRVMPPPEMVANLRAGNIDGFLGPEPFNQRAVYDGVGFIHILSRDIWDGHPCCAFGVPPISSSRTRTPSPRCTAPSLTAAEWRATGRTGPIMAKAVAGQLPEPAGNRAGAGADRQVCRRPGQRARTCRTGSISTPSRGSRWRSGS